MRNLKSWIWLPIWLVFLATARAQSPAEAQLAEQYLAEQSYDKALPLYEKLYRQHPDSKEYLSRTLTCHVGLKQYTEALAVVNKAIRRAPEEPVLVAMKGTLLGQIGQKAEGEALWQQLITKGLAHAEDFAQVAQYFSSIRMYALAVRTYTQARIVLHAPTAYSAELANAYQECGSYGPATTELLNGYLVQSSPMAVVQATILSYSTAEHAPAVEKALLAAVGEHPNDTGLAELLYSFYLQIQDYDEALLRARALDRVLHEDGRRVYLLAQTLQANHQYELSNRALNYITQNLKESPFFQQAYLEQAKNYEFAAAETRPTDTLRVREAVKGYDALLTQFGRRPALAEAMYRKANLCAFYLNDLPAAQAELAQLEALPLSDLAKADERLLLGDILLIQGNYSEAKLQYQRVESSLQEGQAGAKAKFRSARLAYFKGDFEWAKARLSTLKDNTSDDIANDAIQLYLLIQDNTGLDSTQTALKRFAQAGLLAYQHHYTQSLSLLDSLLNVYPGNTLIDDILWQKANIYVTQKQIGKAITCLELILEKYSDEYLADDALFTEADLYQYELLNTAKAQQLYLDLITRYPESVYKVEARKRIRQLRGEGT